MSENGKFLKIRNARENNLKEVSLDIPHDKFTVITGLSGSGKSSLAFDTAYAEGQRRYIETFSPYTRQFFDKVKKPDVDAIENVRPAIAIEQRTKVTGSRSTVGTMTNINDYLKILWANLAKPVCPSCGIELSSYDAKSLTEKIAKLFTLKPDSTFLIVAPVVVPEKETPLKKEIERLLEAGFSRFISAGDSTVHPIEEFPSHAKYRVAKP